MACSAHPLQSGVGAAYPGYEIEEKEGEGDSDDAGLGGMTRSGAAGHKHPV